jgi:putrescine transport system permease protein
MTGWRRALMLGVPYLWMAVLFLAPLAIVIQISFSEGIDGAPPYAPLIDTAADGSSVWRGSLEAYWLIFADSLYAAAFLNSVRIAATATLICLIIGYPMAYAIARAPVSRRAVLLTLVMLPFWTSFLIRVYAWMTLLRPTGLINQWLQALGLITEPLPLMNNEFAVHLGIVYSYLPFMILPLYAAIEKIDGALLDAAADLGSRPADTFRTVTLPLSLPGIVAGCLIVFIPAVGEFVIPDLLGGPDSPMIGRVLWSEFFSNRDWPTASALTVVLLVLLVMPILVFQRLESRVGESR